MVSKDPLVSNSVVYLIPCCFFVIFVVLGSWYCGLFERICIVQTIGERCSMCTVPSSSCFGMVASRDRLHQKRQWNHLWLRPAVGGQQKLFDCVRVNKFSCSLEKCWFPNSRTERESYCMTVWMSWAYCFWMSTSSLLCAVWDFVSVCMCLAFGCSVVFSLLVLSDSIYHQYKKVCNFHVHVWETVRTGTAMKTLMWQKSTAVHVIQFRLYEASRGHIEAK